LENQPYQENIKHNKRNYMEKTTSKEVIFNQFRQPIRNMNEKLDKLNDLKQDHENKLKRIQCKKDS